MNVTRNPRTSAGRDLVRDPPYSVPDARRVGYGFASTPPGHTSPPTTDPTERRSAVPEADTPTKPAPSALHALRDDAGSRKKFLRMLGGGGAAATLAGLLAACGNKNDGNGSSGSNPNGRPTPDPDPAKAGGDVTILNYALTLEYLEADFYRQVIASGLIKDPKVANLAKAFGDTERQHVAALKATVRKLGGTPAAAPRTKFEPTLAKGLDTVLMTAATIENVGAAAYLGQADRIKDKEILAAALSIHSVEARHAATLNQLVGRGFRGNNPLSGSIPDGAFAQKLVMEQVRNQIKPFIAA